MSELQARVAVAQATLDEFRSRPFEIGKSDCAQMAKFHARKFGCPIKGISKAGSYKSALTMRRALKRLGVENVGDIIARQKGYLEIAPASALPADLIELEGDDGPDGIGVLAVVLTNGRVATYHEDAPNGVIVAQPTEYRRAWRLPWKAS